MKCRNCKIEFEPYKRNGIVLSRLCTACLILKGKEKIDRDKIKKDKEWKKEAKDRLKTHSEWLNELQVVFNSFIRARDKGNPCISCGKPYGTFTESAGHYYSVGAYPNLRFNEDNCHLQCWYNCNKNKSGNIVEYTPKLIEKIGIERFNKLVEDKNKPLNLSTEEIKEKIIYYKKQLKNICNSK